MSNISQRNYNTRWYDPALGRFAQADSIVPPGVHPHRLGAGGLDRYAYVNNSPMNYTDPTGHLSCSHPNAAEGDCFDLPSDYGVSYTAGKDFIKALEEESGFWSANMNGDETLMIDYIIKVIVDFEGYSYSRPDVCQSKNNSYCDFQKGTAEAVTRKIYGLYNDYGMDGFYAGVGSYEAIRRRIDLYQGANNYGHNLNKDQMSLDYLMTPIHMDRVESVMDDFASPDWKSGPTGNRPYDIGNPSIQPGIFDIIRKNGVGENSNQVYFMSKDNKAFILSYDQALCIDQQICR